MSYSRIELTRQTSPPLAAFVNRECRLWGRMTGCSLLLIVLSVGLAFAQSNQSSSSPWSYSDLDGRWFLDAGLEIEREPTFPGSDRSETEPFPELLLTYRGSRGHQYALGLGELVAKFRLSGRTSVVLSAGLEEGREEDEDERLAGLDAIDDGVDVGISLWHRRGPWLFAAQVQRDFGNDKGLVWFLGTAGSGICRTGEAVEGVCRCVGRRRRPHAVRVRDHGGGIRSHRPFGVCPRAGTENADLWIRSRPLWKKRWALTFAVEVEGYIGDAPDSPLISDLGSETGVEASVGFLYRWFK